MSRPRSPRRGVRHDEQEDYETIVFFGLVLIDGFAEVALKLGEYRRLDPGPIEEWIFFDHPSGRNRIHMAMTWKAEHLDE